MKKKSATKNPSTQFSQQEMLTLLGIGTAITKAKSRVELLAAIRDKVMGIIPFYGTRIFIVEPDGLHHYDLAVNIKGWDDSDGSTQLQRHTNLSRIIHPGSYIALVMDKLQIAGGPLIADYEPVMEEWDHPFFSIKKETGYKKAMAALLTSGGKSYGTLWLNSLDKDGFNEKQLTFFGAIAEQVSVALANIIANEAILNENQSKKVLLTISEHIAAINNRKELFAVIINEIKPLIPVDDTGILVLNKEGTKWCDWTNIDNYQETRTAAQLHENGFTGFMDMDHITERSFNETGILSIDYYLAIAHPFAPIMAETGLKEFMFTPLISQGKKIGSLFFDSKQYGTYSEKHFTQFRSIANMIASAVHNIMANEEIAEREKEKTKLLEITKLIAQVKGNDDLLRLTVQKIKPIFNFHDCGVFVLNADGKTHTDLAAVLPDVSPSEWNEFLPDVSLDIPHPNSPVEWMMDKISEADRPVLFDFWELVELFPEYPQFSGPDILKMGYRDCLAYNLIVRGKSIGMFCINALQKNFFKPSVYSIFQSVAESISIAVANILANEEILEREKEKSMLLEITEALNKCTNRLDVLKGVIHLIGKLYQFDYSSLLMINEEEGYYQLLIHSETVGESNLPNCENDKKAYHKSAAQWMASDFNISLLKDVQANFPDNPHFQQLEKLGIQQMLYGPLFANNRIIGIFCICSRLNNVFNPKNLLLFRHISEQISIAVANIIANEEIISLNKQLEAQNAYLVEEVEQQYNFEEMIGQNPKFAEVCKNIGLVAKTDTTVLILGETGTGKELVARAIHNNSPRKGKPLIKLNCAALPASLVESELFGHERGSFTGAFERRVGKFELANGSTLFLDEVGELPLELQAKLLRALQEREIERLGSNKTIKVDVRIIAATNRDLNKEVKAGKFRQDLFYRLHIFPITLPPLRERKEDIPLLATHFIQRYAQKNGKKIQGLSNQALQEVMSYNFPGNIRELEHIIERSVIISNSKLIQDLNLPDVSKMRTSTASSEFILKTWQEQERDYILEVLRLTNGNVKGKGGAAELLQLPPTTLQSKMNKLGIKRKHFLEGQR